MLLGLEEVKQVAAAPVSPSLRVRPAAPLDIVGRNLVLGLQALTWSRRCGQCQAAFAALDFGLFTCGMRASIASWSIIQ